MSCNRDHHHHPPRTLLPTTMAAVNSMVFSSRMGEAGVQPRPSCAPAMRVWYVDGWFPYRPCYVDVLPAGKLSSSSSY
ncbi:hypothetical protein BRADI_1g00625v3 [Brachypodium distachyon]|uniref:Uncharacterized protein n=1 Tax=Brachypodium distachyon TaxID=15368 RepID=A0A0Q3J1Y7_BRADI|nr:hypothetical protein BRADI_1g00625v3 [Brachypodium distachyon]